MICVKESFMEWHSKYRIKVAKKFRDGVTLKDVYSLSTTVVAMLQ